jgi:hypothetical protein
VLALINDSALAGEGEMAERDRLVMLPPSRFGQGVGGFWWHESLPAIPGGALSRNLDGSSGEGLGDPQILVGTDVGGGDVVWAGGAPGQTADA